MGEVANSSVAAYLDSNKEHAKLVSALVKYDNKQDNVARQNLAKMKALLPVRV